MGPEINRLRDNVIYLLVVLSTNVFLLRNFIQKINKIVT